MRVFKAPTATAAWEEAVTHLLDPLNGHRQPGRGGPTVELLHTLFELTDPRQRWVARPVPINPSFAVAELVWILTGRQDAAFLTFWLPSLPTYIGNGTLAHGAYGHRLRHHFGLDQLERAFEVLRHDPDSRQVVLQLWDPRADLPGLDGRPVSSDIPCNVTSLLKMRDGRLDWMQVMRSNDIYRGTPYNFIQFTVLQEVMAGWLGIESGTYFHLSDSLHAYERDLPALRRGGPPVPVEVRNALALPKAESDAAWRDLERALSEIIQEPYRQEGLRALADLGLPEGHADLLKLALSEAARKRQWADLEEELLLACQDPGLRDIGQRWSRRQPGERLRRTEGE